VVEFGCAAEQVWTGDTEVEKGALYWPGQVEHHLFQGCPRLAVPGTTARLVTIAAGFGSHGRGKDSAGGAGRLGYVSDRHGCPVAGVGSDPVPRQHQIRAGRLRSVKEGNARLIPADAITDYVALLEAEAEAPR
jgi:hypothetical protein